MWLHPRLEVQGPDLGWRPWRIHLLPGADEYGNRSVYCKTILFYVVIFPFPGFQRDVAVPEPGTNPWIDAVWWQDIPPRPTHSEKGKGY